MAAVIAISTGVVVVANDDDPESTVDVGGAPEVAAASLEPGWNQLPDPPLSPRVGASAAWTGNEVVVVGGWEFLCPPEADCAFPPEPPFTDGAAFDPVAGDWRPIADAPVHLHGIYPEVVDGKVFFLVDCTIPGSEPTDGSPPGVRCPGTDDPVVLLRYDPAGDAWTLFPGPRNSKYHALKAVGSSLVAFSTSDEGGETPDWQFDMTTETWSELPDDPLPEVFDRSVVSADDGETILVFGAEMGSESEPSEETNVAARLDLTTMTWTELPPSPSRGFRAWSLDEQVFLEPHFGGTGGLFDPATNTWSPLPPPTSASFDSNAVAGSIGRDGALYAAASGWVFDASSGEWLEIEPIDDRSVFPNTSVATVGRDLFVFGGERWPTSEGELLGDAWLWVAPAPTD